MSPSSLPGQHAAGARGMRAALALLAALSAATAWASDSPPKAAPEVRRAESAALPDTPSGGPTILPRRADLGQERASAQTKELADWVLNSRDNQDMPFMIVDKINARVFMFDPLGRLKGTAPALLGLARGDDSTPGIGERSISSILPGERTTPAGRFVASLDHDARGKELLWVDYATALALHRVVKGTPAEQRAQRLESATADDNRISYGCINVPAIFYDKVVSPAFSQTSGVVYILPESRSNREVFGSYGLGAQQSPLSGPGAPGAGSPRGSGKK